MRCCCACGRLGNQIKTIWKLYIELLYSCNSSSSLLFCVCVCFLTCVLICMRVCMCSLVCICTHCCLYKCGGQMLALGISLYLLPCLRQCLFAVLHGLCHCSWSLSFQGNFLPLSKSQISTEASGL